MKNLAQIINNRDKFVLKTGFDDMFTKYSLKDRDYRSGRFDDVEKELFGVNELLSITKPDVVSEIFERFLKVGVDIIATNTEISNREMLRELTLEEMTYELNLNAAKLAREEVSKYSTITIDKQRFAAGCISAINNQTDSEILKNVYLEQVKALFAGKIDLLFLKNFNDEVNINSALDSLNDLMIKRSKTTNILFCSSNKEMAEYVDSKIINNSYSNLNFVSLGYSLNLSENLDENIFKDFNFSLCSIKMNERISDEVIMKFIENLKENKKVKVVSIEDNFPPDLVNKIVNTLQK
jgi:methionine synthase I (cobalamin-dependent)